MNKIKELDDVKIDYVRIPSAIISSDQEYLVKMDKATDNSLHFIRGKGNDQGEIYKKDSKFEEFFKAKKTYKTK